MSTGGVHEESKKKILEFAKHASGNVVSIPSQAHALHVHDEGLLGGAAEGRGFGD